MDLGTHAPEYRYGFIAVDGFSKMASVIPIENKQPDEIIRALKKVIGTLGKPQQTCSDEVGAFLIQTNTLNLLTNKTYNTYRQLPMHTLLNDL